MKDKQIDEFSDYSSALELFKQVYLYPGHRQYISEYANSYVGRGENDIVRNDRYSSCIESEANGARWKIVSPRNIFGVALEHSVNHKDHNKVTSSLFLNSGRYDINRIIEKFATIDVSEKSDEEILALVEAILSKTNEEVISDFEIKSNPNGILVNSIILDTVLAYLKAKGQTRFPELSCNSDSGDIAVKGNGSFILINNSFVQYDNQTLNYTMTRNFPNCKYEVDAIRGDNELFGMISESFVRLNNKEKEKSLETDILNLALANQKLKADRQSAKELYSEYLELSDNREKRDREDD